METATKVESAVLRNVRAPLRNSTLQGCFSVSLQLCAAVDQLPADSVAKPRFVALAELTTPILNEGRLAVQGLRSAHEHLRSLGQAFAAVPSDLGLIRRFDFDSPYMSVLRSIWEPRSTRVCMASSPMVNLVCQQGNYARSTDSDSDRAITKLEIR